MRVPPEIIAPGKGLNLAAASLLMAVSIAAIGIYGGADRTKQTNKVTKRQIVIALKDIQTGQAITREDIGMAIVPLESSPQDSITSFNQVLGARAGTYIPKTMPIASWLLAGNPDEVANIESEGGIAVDGEPNGL